MASRLTDKSSFYEVLTAAVADFAEHGFDTQERLEFWQTRIRRAAERSLISVEKMQENVAAALTSIYRRLVDRDGVLRTNAGVSRFTVDLLTPRLRVELDKRIFAAANLIKTNRPQVIEKTLQRFAGWATSVSAGGSGSVDKNETKTAVRKALVQMPTDERRLATDQGHKLFAAINEIVAVDAGAIAVRWHSNWRQRSYNYRPDHKERDDRVYAIRGSWASQQGLINKGAGYTDEMTTFAEEPGCKCHGEYVHALRSVPIEMLTKKGEEVLAASQSAARRSRVDRDEKRTAA